MRQLAIRPVQLFASCPIQLTFPCNRVAALPPGLFEWLWRHVPLVTRVHKRVLKRMPAGDRVWIGNSVSSTALSSNG